MLIPLENTMLTKFQLTGHVVFDTSEYPIDVEQLTVMIKQIDRKELNSKIFRFYNTLFDTENFIFCHKGTWMYYYHDSGHIELYSWENNYNEIFANLDEEETQTYLNGWSVCEIDEYPGEADNLFILAINSLVKKGLNQ